jgi:hypothetical protein
MQATSSRLTNSPKAGYLTQAAAQQPQAPAARQARAIPPDALVALLRDMQRTMERIAGAVETLTSEMRTMQQRSMPPRDSRAAVAPQDAPLAPPHPSPMLLGTYDPHVATARIQDLRRQGWSLTRIADQLTAEGIPTRYGLPWQYSSVRHLLKTYGKEHEG